jgi:type II secretory pathway pseudopilin PulG
MKGRSRSTLFLMEQLVVIAVFAICAAVCVRLLFAAYQINVDAVDTRHALILAENVAESFKAFNGDIDNIFETVWGEPVGSGVAFHLSLERRGVNGADLDDSPVIFADIYVARVLNTSGDLEYPPLVNLTVATRNPWFGVNQ